MLRKDFIAKSNSLVNQITDFLTNAIITGELESGERLVENELQRRFGISRGPIRESFRILEKKGLLITKPRKGTSVRMITRDYIKEIFPIRSRLESLAARLAVPHLEPKDIQGMELALTGMIEAKGKKDLDSYIKNHFDFNQIFAEASKNNSLIEMLENLSHQTIWFIFSPFCDQENYEYRADVHREILDLFIQKDADRVEILVREHILTAYNTFFYSFCEPNNKKVARSVAKEQGSLGDRRWQMRISGADI